MKLPFIVLAPFIVLLTISCDQATFNQPQPVGVKNIYHFPKKMRGQWVKIEISHNTEIGSPVIEIDTITISKNLFHQITHVHFWFHKDQLDSMNWELRDGKLISTEDDDTDEMIESFTLQNDSVILHEDNSKLMVLGDTVFLRKLSKNSYILNRFRSENAWKIFHIEIKDDKTISCSYPEEKQFDLLQKLTSQNIVKKDSIWNISIYPDEMKLFIDSGGFNNNYIDLYRDEKIK